MKTHLPPESLTVSDSLSDNAIQPQKPRFRDRLLQPLRDSFTACGVGLVLISATIFGLTERLLLKDEEAFSVFTLHYGMAFAYGIFLFFKWMRKAWLKKPTERKFTPILLLWLVLNLISCYALNRSIPIFQSATGWMCVYILISSAACTIYIWKNEMPPAARSVLYFLLAASLWLFVYLAAYIAPMYAFGAIGLLLLGLGGHAFIPLIFSIVLSVHLWKSVARQPMLRWSVIAGLVLPLAFATYFLLHWQANLLKIHRIENQLFTRQHTLPTWVLLSQKLQNDWITERLLKTDLVYSTRFWEDGFDRFPTRSFDAVHEHDPLVTIATQLLGKADFSKDEQIQLLESLYDARHQAQTRLWSGDELSTHHVYTNVKVYPEYRLAYTEKVLTIRNHSHYEWTEQEAIYTFHLPEGSVVTSLSLWINGVEEPARLTTKSKADSAYTTIVGREMRDPSVVHWQEGNTVSVRVFPCTPRENCRFKIGITSPLRVEDHRLYYDNIYFQGPSTTQTEENASVEFATSPKDLHGLEGFSPETGTIFQQEDYSYRPDRSFSFEAPTLASQSFVFGGKNYGIKPYQKEYQSFIPSTVYLDVNNAWTLRDYEETLAAARSVKAKVLVWDEQWMEATESNQLALYEKLWQNRFSLLPIHRIAAPEKALIVSKTDAPSPNLNDLKDSQFAHELAGKARQNHPVRMFNLGHELSPYLKTLTELRVLHYDRGNTQYLKQLLTDHRFIKNQEDARTVTLPQAEMQLTETTTNKIASSRAPDHLLRLFTYNHLMQQIGPRYFEKDYISDALITEAQRAYVVSPVSSLIVLETKKDYERFGIDESKNSLKNASLNSSGAVPEPHEWLLIITFVTVVLLVWWRQR